MRVQIGENFKNKNNTLIYMVIYFTYLD